MTTPTSFGNLTPVFDAEEGTYKFYIDSADEGKVYSYSIALTKAYPVSDTATFESKARALMGTKFGSRHTRAKHLFRMPPPAIMILGHTGVERVLDGADPDDPDADYQPASGKPGGRLLKILLLEYCVWMASYFSRHSEEQRNNNMARALARARESSAAATEAFMDRARRAAQDPTKGTRLAAMEAAAARDVNDALAGKSKGTKRGRGGDVVFGKKNCENDYN